MPLVPVTSWVLWRFKYPYQTVSQPMCETFYKQREVLPLLPVTSWVLWHFKSIHIRRSLNQSVKHFMKTGNCIIDIFTWLLCRHQYPYYMVTQRRWETIHRQDKYCHVAGHVVVLWGYQHHMVTQPKCVTFYKQMLY